MISIFVLFKKPSYVKKEDDSWCNYHFKLQSGCTYHALKIINNKNEIMVLSDYMRAQYAWIRNSRNTLFDYCNTLSSDDFVKTVPFFGNGGSIKSLLLHVANTYEAWIVKRGLGSTPHFVTEEMIINMGSIVSVYNRIDKQIDTFMETKGDQNLLIEFNKNDLDGAISPLQLFSHVTTHEFHHKGQILSLSRYLGYMPIDTDVIR